MDEQEIFVICQKVDSYLAEYLKESVIKGTSFNMLEAHYGVLPDSRTGFYRKKRRVLELLNMQQETDKMGQKNPSSEV